MALQKTYFTEEERRLSFTEWVNPWITSEELIKSGFFFYGQEDVVECCFCGIKLELWTEENVVDIEHLRYSPLCSFIQEKLKTANSDILLPIITSVIRDGLMMRHKLDALERCFLEPIWCNDNSDISSFVSSVPEEVEELEDQELSDSGSDISCSSCCIYKDN